MTSDAFFRIYSMTKPVTSVAAMILVEEGRLQVSDPVAKILPEIAEMKVGTEKPAAEGKPTLELAPPAREAAYSASGDSKYVTGQDLVIDGGITTSRAGVRTWRAHRAPQAKRARRVHRVESRPARFISMADIASLALLRSAAPRSSRPPQRCARCR